jgi:hypothetical protein
MHGMYAVRRWDEEVVIKWLAVGMILAMLGMAVMPAVSAGDLTWYLTHDGAATGGVAAGTGAVVAAGISAAELSGLALMGAVTGGVGLVIGAAL